mmetsp:Transcript_1667/g.3926  ORF Transcript_1667/g.3926 Transcript_1667/m.3926 type:complete len:151 (+) Transcript_1667:62-514(+)|eukprot:CAMPEP_0170582092 /NCGR_PEP_ID=MMETSP0224-20130122/7395_1 /TAXON_ID=285029 /ORGANISM="Togula jolla, Strain CCCM 725" /LENGTH=150 /DNA_ID=CAMNT_0010905285 /DNA_START=58 /DNA_END=510 /DNA_ORIENTATION=-
MAISIMPFPHLAVALAQFGYPLVCYLDKFDKGSAPNEEFAQWTTYWVLCAIWMFVESNFLWFLLDYFPLFLELKLLGILWLVHPDYKGAAYFWYAHLKPIHKKYDEAFYPKLVNFVESAHFPEAAKVQGMCSDTNVDNDEVIESMLKKGK